MLLKITSSIKLCSEDPNRHVCTRSDLMGQWPQGTSLNWTKNRLRKKKRQNERNTSRIDSNCQTNRTQKTIWIKTKPMRNICEDESTNRVTGAGCFLHCLKVAASSPKKNPKKPRQPRRSVSLTPIHDCSFSFSFPAVETNVILGDFRGNSRESVQHSRERERGLEHRDGERGVW